VAHGTRMRPGCDDIKLRELKLREAMLVRQGGSCAGYPTLLVNMDACPNLVSEIKGFRKKVIRQVGREIVTDDGNRKATHAVEALEQAVGYGCPYVRPPAPAKLTSGTRSGIMSLVEYVRSLRKPSNGDGDGIVLGARSPG
jgi:hypothetical protein